MNDYKLVINPFAELDLEIAKEWYDIQKEELGADFVYEIGKTLNRISKNPHQFPKIKPDIRRAEVNRFPFGIYYICRKKLITVFAVFHNSRNPAIWKQRAKK